MKLTTFSEHLLLVLALVLTAGYFAHKNILWRWDNLVYDTQLSFWSRDIADDIIIVAIDDQSLYDIGHWPWARSTHAELIRKLDSESPQAIGLDILFSEPDQANPESDRLLGEAIQTSGKVVLPVYMARQSRNAVPIEALPLPMLTTHAAALGHVYADIDKDGIARTIYLREGIGKPHWNHFSVAMLEVAGFPIKIAESSAQDQDDDYSSMQWARQHPFLIPYAGPPGHFPSIGYSQVLNGNYPAGIFRDKIVLIGATAEGMGDSLPTPFSAGQGNMPGVEVIANMIDALRSDLRIQQLNDTALIVLTMLLVAIPILLYPYLNPTHTLLLMSAMILLSLGLVATLLWWLGVWVPASTIILFQLLSYPLWSWRRLVLAMRHVNRELDQLLSRQSEFSLKRDRQLGSELEFLAAFIALDGWVAFDAKGRRMLYQGSIPPKFTGSLDAGLWHNIRGQRWARFNFQGEDCLIGLNLTPGTVLNTDQQRLLDNLILAPEKQLGAPSGYLEDVLQTRISQVQAVGNEYKALQRIIEDSLSGMADGVLICNSHGQVMFSNHRAGW